MVWCRSSRWDVCVCVRVCACLHVCVCVGGGVSTAWCGVEVLGGVCVCEGGGQYCLVWY